MLTNDLTLLRKEKSLGLEVASGTEEVYLFERFVSKAERDSAFSEIEAMVREVGGMELFSAQGDDMSWPAARQMFCIPRGECLIEDVSCDYEATGSGRLYITPFFACFTEGVGRERILEVMAFQHMLDVDTKKAGAITFTMKDGQRMKGKGGKGAKSKAPLGEGERRVVLHNIRSKDKAAVLLDQLRYAVRKQVCVLLRALPHPRLRACVGIHIHRSFCVLLAVAVVAARTLV